MWGDESPPLNMKNGEEGLIGGKGKEEKPKWKGRCAWGERRGNMNRREKKNRNMEKRKTERKKKRKKKGRKKMKRGKGRSARSE